MKRNVRDANGSLYLIASQGQKTEAEYAEQICQLIDGGVDMVQMREKHMAFEARIRIGRMLLEICHQRGVPLVVNDDANLAQKIGADGLHIGQDDLPPRKARSIVGPNMFIGQSTHDLKQVAWALADTHVDMLGFGPIFDTTTKDAGPPRGCALLAEAMRLRPSKPIWAIGGITSTSLPTIVASGCRRVAVSSALLKSEHPRQIATQLRELLDRRAD